MNGNEFKTALYVAERFGYGHESAGPICLPSQNSNVTVVSFVGKKAKEEIDQLEEARTVTRRHS